MSENPSAQEFATQKHSGQFRRNGLPYIEHPKAVASHVRRVKGHSHKIKDLEDAAWLHDTLEDTDTTNAEILSTFNPNVMTLVHELTSDEEELKKLGKTEYLKKKFVGISSWALLIKLADRLTNLSDLMEADKAWATKYATQTQDVIDYLLANRKLTSPQQQLVREIQEILTEFFETTKE